MEPLERIVIIKKENKMKTIKRIFLLGIFLSFNTLVLYAQGTIKAGTYTINEIDYKISKNDTYSFYSIYRPNRPRLPQNREIVNNIPLDYIKTRLTNQDVWKQLVKESLGMDKVKELKQNGEELELTFYFRPNGSVFFILYKLATQTDLTIEDVARIDQVLMKDYKGTFTSINDGHQYLYYIDINSELNFADE